MGYAEVRVGEASNPGPPRISHRISRASQQSGVLTVPAASNELRAFRRGVSHSAPTWGDSIDGVARIAKNRFAALNDPASVEIEVPRWDTTQTSCSEFSARATRGIRSRVGSRHGQCGRSF